MHRIHVRIEFSMQFGLGFAKFDTREMINKEAIFPHPHSPPSLFHPLFLPFGHQALVGYRRGDARLHFQGYGPEWRLDYSHL